MAAPRCLGRKISRTAWARRSAILSPGLPKRLAGVERRYGEFPTSAPDDLIYAPEVGHLRLLPLSLAGLWSLVPLRHDRPPSSCSAGIRLRDASSGVRSRGRGSPAPASVPPAPCCPRRG